MTKKPNNFYAERYYAKWRRPIRCLLIFNWFIDVSSDEQQITSIFRNYSKCRAPFFSEQKSPSNLSSKAVFYDNVHVFKIGETRFEVTMF